MSYTTAASIIHFVNNIPENTNPFLATSELFLRLTKVPAAPAWTHVSTRLCLVGYVIMLLQSVFLLAQRLKLGSFKTLQFNKLGLLAIRVSDPAAVFILFYSALTIEFLVSQLAEEEGFTHWWSEVVLFQVKFLILLANAWAFLWVSSCQCAVILWEADVVRNLSSKQREVVQATIKCGMNIFFPFAVIAPVPLVIYKASITYSCFGTVLSMVHELCTSLIGAADTFNAQTYNKLVFLQSLTPAQAIYPPFHKMESSTRFIIRFWMVLITILSFICIPLLLFALSRLYMDPASQNAQPSKMNIKICTTRNRLVCHAMFVYLSVAINLPALIWLDSHSSTGFGLDSRWRAVCFHGLTAPFCITGNIMILILNRNSRDALCEMRSGQADTSDESCIEEGASIRKSYTNSVCVITPGEDESIVDVVVKAG